MRMEVHVHGTVLLRAGTTPTQIEEALRPWLEYIDEDNLADAKSVHPDEPGILFDKRRRVLEVCWTGDVGRSFHQIVSDALASLNPFSEEAAAFEVSYYLEDGQDEFSVVFVGPTAGPDLRGAAQAHDRRRAEPAVAASSPSPKSRRSPRSSTSCSSATGKAAALPAQTGSGAAEDCADAAGKEAFALKRAVNGERSELVNGKRVTKYRVARR